MRAGAWSGESPAASPPKKEACAGDDAAEAVAAAGLAVAWRLFSTQVFPRTHHTRVLY